MRKHLYPLILLLFCSSSYAVENGKEFGDWKVQCTDEETQQCHIFQDLLEKESKQRVLHISVGKLQGNEDIATILTLPLGISLPPGIGIRIGDQDPKAIPLQACFTNGCQAAIKLDQESIAAMREQNEAEVYFYNLENKAIAIPVSLRGFSDALNAITK